MDYQCEATSVAGFVQQIACSYLRHGYRWYVTGIIPRHKDPRRTDEKLIRQYEIGLPRRTRARRKELGYANLQYLRYQRFFVLLATDGRHRFRDEEAARDIRQVPLRFAGYSISSRRGGRTRAGERDARWHAHVQIAWERYKELKADFRELARHRSAETLIWEFQRLPFEPYAPVRRQYLHILRDVNRVRKQTGYELLDASVLRLRRRPVKVFANDNSVAGKDENTQPRIVLTTERWGSSNRRAGA